MYDNEERLWLGGAAHEGVEERKLVEAAPVSQRRIGLRRHPGITALTDFVIGLIV